MSEILEAALEYAERGWRVVPIVPGEKRPAITDWVNKATTDVEVIERWWSANRGCGVGIVTGRESGIFVVDIDGEKGAATLRELEAKHGKLPPTFSVKTGGGYHFYFRYPDFEIRNDASKRLGPGLDIRGEGGQVVAPPTIHPNGTAYKKAEVELPVAPAPAWLLELLHKVDVEIVPAVALPSPTATAVGTLTTIEDERPGDRFASENEWADLLENDGATFIDETNGCSTWYRPGKTSGHLSATVGYSEADNLHVFSTNWPGLDADTSYTKFGYLAATKFGGDFNAAATALANDERTEQMRRWGVEALVRPYVQAGADASKQKPPESLTTSKRPGRSQLFEKKLPHPNEPMAVARQIINNQYTTTDGFRSLLRWQGDWWRWLGPRWERVEDREVTADLYRSTDGATYKDRFGEHKWSPNISKIANLSAALAAQLLLEAARRPPSWINEVDFPGAREFVACTNGLLHVPTRLLNNHDPRLFNLVAVPFEYDPNAELPRDWLGFLEELWPDDPDSIAALQEYFGYIISGRTDLQKILLVIGPTRAGKGVIGAIMRALIGDGNYVGPTLSSLSQNFGLQPLIGKPLAIVSDARLGGANVRQIVERLLSISGEDALTVDRKYREQWTGRLPTRFVVMSNELPNFGDASGAIARRFVVLSLTKSFIGREDPELTNRLLPECPGIFNWALDGLARLNDVARFTEPSSSKDAVIALQDLVSPVGAFVRECCGMGADAVVEKQELFEAWGRWCDETGHGKGTRETFGQKLRAVIPGLTITRPGSIGSRVYSYKGVRLNSNNNWDLLGRLDAGNDSGGFPLGPLGPAYDQLQRGSTRAGEEANHVENLALAKICDRCKKPAARLISNYADNQKFCPACCKELDVTKTSDGQLDLAGDDAKAET